MSIDNATEYIIDFIEYAEKWNKENKIIKIRQQKEGEFIVPVWNLYIKIQEKQIYPYTGTYQTRDIIRKNVTRKY